MLQDLLAQRAIDGSLDVQAVDAACKDEETTRSSIFNRIAITLARSFQSGELDFDDADRGIGVIYSMMILHPMEGEGVVLAEPAFSIYEAFDAGEFYDTTLQHTRMRLAEILQSV